MLSYGLISLLALATASTAGPVSGVRRGSSLIPTPPPACLALASNSTATASNITSGASSANLTDTSSTSNITSGADSANLTDTSSISNITSSANVTTTTCLLPASNITSLMGMNSTDLSNLTSSSNCTTMTNSTSLGDTGAADSSCDPADPSCDTTSSCDPTDPSCDPTSSGDTTGSSDTTSTSTLAPPDNSTTTTTDSAQTTTTTSSTDSAQATTTTSSTDSAQATTTTSSSAPPADAAPPPDTSSSSDTGSSGIATGSGQFTANTQDTQGRKRSFLAARLPSWVPSFRRDANYRRTSQADLPSVAQNWQDLCLASGGDIFTNQPCVQLAGIAGINALLSTGGACDQQDNADNMIDFANSAGVTNQADLIAAAIAYRQHPRNADDIGGGITPSTPYCTKAPRNQELVGIVNGQLPGVDPGLFGGPNTPIVAFGGDGSCPAGQTPDVSTCSCA